MSSAEKQKHLNQLIEIYKGLLTEHSVKIAVYEGLCNEVRS